MRINATRPNDLSDQDSSGMNHGGIRNEFWEEEPGRRPWGQ